MNEEAREPVNEMKVEKLPGLFGVTVKLPISRGA